MGNRSIGKGTGHYNTDIGRRNSVVKVRQIPRERSNAKSTWNIIVIILRIGEFKSNELLEFAGYRKHELISIYILFYFAISISLRFYKRARYLFK